LFPAERTDKRMIKEFKFDGAHGQIVAKKVFALLSPQTREPKPALKPSAAKFLAGRRERV